MQIVARLVALRRDGPLQPRNYGVQLALMNEVGAAVVVGIAELRFDRDGLLALLNGMIEPPEEAVCAVQERMRLRSGMRGKGGPVQADGFLDIVAHVLAIRLLEELDGLPLSTFRVLVRYCGAAWKTDQGSLGPR
jgi:hypothetical protein